MKSTNLVSLLSIVFFSLHIGIAQNASVEPQYFNWFDNEVQRNNTSLFNGLEYIELYRTINDKHKFYGTSDFQFGSVVYDGQFFDQVPLKYDLDADDLLLNVGYNYPYPILILIKSKVERFSLPGADFIQVPENIEELKEHGFYQILLENSLVSLLKKNFKKRFKRIRGSTLYYEFIQEVSFAIKYDGTYYEISNKQDVVRIWPDQRDYINENYNNSLKKADEEIFWTNFFTKLSDEINSQNRG